MKKLTKLQIKNIEDVLEAKYYNEKLNKKDDKYLFIFKEKCYIGIELIERSHGMWPKIKYTIWTEGKECGYEFTSNDFNTIGDIIHV